MEPGQLLTIVGIVASSFIMERDAHVEQETNPRKPETKMKCDHGRGTRNHCREEVVGRATDKFGSIVYCELHLTELENYHDPTITIVRFGNERRW